MARCRSRQFAADEPEPVPWHDTYLWLWVADHKPADQLRAVQLGNTFKSELKLVDNGQAYGWNYANPILPGDSFATRQRGFEPCQYRRAVCDRCQPEWLALQRHRHDAIRPATFTAVMCESKTSAAPTMSAYVNGTGGSESRE